MGQAISETGNLYKLCISKLLMYLSAAVQGRPGKLDSCLPAFHASVHWQDLVIPKKRSDVLFKLSQDVIVECSRSQTQLGDLI